jgi:hypothetical protein
MTQLHFSKALRVTHNSFAAVWVPGTLQDATLLLPQEVQSLVQDFGSLEEFLSAVHASPTAFTVGLGWTAEDWSTAKRELLILLAGKVDPKWINPPQFPKRGMGANPVSQDAPLDVDVTIEESSELIPGTYEWATQQTVPTARYCKRTGMALAYMSLKPEEDYPEKEEDRAATDWEHDRGLAQKPLNVGRLPNVHPREALKVFLRMFPTVRIGIKSNHPDCKLPGHLRTQEGCTLIVGLKCQIHIPDLRATQLGLYCTLSFAGKRHECYIPWDAFLGVANENDHKQGLHWGTV